MSLNVLTARLESFIQATDENLPGMEEVSAIASGLRTLSHEGMFRSTERERALLGLVTAALAHQQGKEGGTFNLFELAEWFANWRNELQGVIKVNYDDFDTPTVSQTLEKMDPVLRHISCLFIANKEYKLAFRAMNVAQELEGLKTLAWGTTVGDGLLGQVGEISFPTSEKDDG